MRGGFGVACLFAAAGVGVDRGDGADALAVGGGREDGVAAVPGSGVMMLTGGVEAAEGNSALVGLPVGTPGISAATGPGGGGAFQVGA